MSELSNKFLQMIVETKINDFVPCHLRMMAGEILLLRKEVIKQEERIAELEGELFDAKDALDNMMSDTLR